MIWQKSSLLLAAALACGMMFHWTVQTTSPNSTKANRAQTSEASTRNDAAAAAAFESIIPVLHHPRCMNCHSTGDFPRQGDDNHQHTMNVRRGLEGQGVAGLQCSTCHQDHNLAGEHTPPGAPDWHLPSPHEPMIWEKLSDRQLCELFKDPARNGHRTVDQIVQHMHTPLVLWGWHPGEGRTPIPMPESEFLAAINKWVANGAPCPSGTRL